MNDQEVMAKLHVSVIVLHSGVVEMCVGGEQLYMEPWQARRIASILIEAADAGDDRKLGS